MENKTILLVNDKYRKMENFYFYDKMPYLSVFFYILRRIRMEENFFILYTIEVKGRERRNMEEKHTCVLNHDEYELLNFYRQLSEERKQKFFDLVQMRRMCVCYTVHCYPYGAGYSTVHQL